MDRSAIRFPAARTARQGGTRLSRRSLLRGAMGVAAAGVATAASCSSEGPTSQATGQVTRHALQAAFPQSVPFVAAGVTTRLPFFVTDRGGAPLAALTGEVPFTVRSGETVLLDGQRLAPRSDGVERAYLPLTFTFPRPGTYDITAEYQGTTMQTGVEAFPLAEVPAPVIGQPLPPTRTPTTDSPLQVDPVCSRSPVCPFHDKSLDDALGSGLPVVLLVASPAYTQSTVCGPVLDHLIELVEVRSDIVVVHCEVYENPKDVADLADADPSPVVASFDLRFEPVLYVTDAAGTVTARADVIVDRSEMAELLPPVA